MDSHTYVVVAAYPEGGYVDKFFNELISAQQFAKGLIENGAFTEIWDEDLNEYPVL